MPAFASMTAMYLFKASLVSLMRIRSSGCRRGGLGVRGRTGLRGLHARETSAHVRLRVDQKLARGHYHVTRLDALADLDPVVRFGTGRHVHRLESPAPMASTTALRVPVRISASLGMVMPRLLRTTVWVRTPRLCMISGRTLTVVAPHHRITGTISMSMNGDLPACRI